MRLTRYISGDFETLLGKKVITVLDYYNFSKTLYPISRPADFCYFRLEKMAVTAYWTHPTEHCMLQLTNFQNEVRT